MELAGRSSAGNPTVLREGTHDIDTFTRLFISKGSPGTQHAAVSQKRDN